MQIQLSQDGETGCAQINGELTIYTAAELKDQLLKQLDQCKKIQLDLSQVEEVDSAGIQVLMLIRKQAIAEEKALTLSQISESLSRYFELYNLWDFFQLLAPAEA